jgi:hypothetical protein
MSTLSFKATFPYWSGLTASAVTCTLGGITASSYTSPTVAWLGALAVSALVGFLVMYVVAKPQSAKNGQTDLTGWIVLATAFNTTVLAVLVTGYLGFTAWALSPVLAILVPLLIAGLLAIAVLKVLQALSTILW